MLHLRFSILVEAAGHASVRQDRYSRSEVRFMTPLDVAAPHREADQWARQARELGADPAGNWNTDLEG